MGMIAKRLTDGAELRSSIEQLVIDSNCTAASIVSAVGSLKSVKIRMAGAQPNKQDIRRYDGSFEIVSLIGNLGLDRTHLHISISDNEGRVIGGHLKEAIVHTTVELVLICDEQLQFDSAVDHKTGFKELMIGKKQ